MTAPTGGARAAGATGGAPVDHVNTDPRRPRPPDQPMTRFLIQIGSEHRPEPQDVGRRYAENGEAQVQEALQLGDISIVDSTAAIAAEMDENGVEITPAREGYPIYEFAGAEGNDALRFTLDPRYGEIVAPSMPPRIPHQPGDIHSDMEGALWGGFCYDYPTEYSHENYEDLMRGITWRYAGEGQVPQFLADSEPDTSSDSDSDSEPPTKKRKRDDASGAESPQSSAADSYYDPDADSSDYSEFDSDTEEPSASKPESTDKSDDPKPDPASKPAPDLE